MESNATAKNGASEAIIKEEIFNNPENKAVNAIDEEEFLMTPEKEVADAEVNEDTFVEHAKLYPKIVKQLRFYFSDTNLPFDKFLRNEADANNGWVKISVLLTFKRLASITENPADVAAAIKNDIGGFLEVDESFENIRRKPDTAVPIATKEYKNELMERSVSCSRFPKNATMDELIEFAASVGDSVCVRIHRRFAGDTFKGKFYLTFKTREDAERFLKQEYVVYKDIELKCMWEKDFLRMKRECASKRKYALREQKINAMTDEYLKSLKLAKFDGLSIGSPLNLDWPKIDPMFLERNRAWIRSLNNQPKSMNSILSTPKLFNCGLVDNKVAAQSTSSSITTLLLSDVPEFDKPFNENKETTAMTEKNLIKGTSSSDRGLYTEESIMPSTSNATAALPLAASAPPLGVPAPPLAAPAPPLDAAAENNSKEEYDAGA